MTSPEIAAGSSGCWFLSAGLHSMGISKTLSHVLVGYSIFSHTDEALCGQDLLLLFTEGPTGFPRRFLYEKTTCLDTLSSAALAELTAKLLVHQYSCWASIAALWVAWSMLTGRRKLLLSSLLFFMFTLKIKRICYLLWISDRTSHMPFSFAVLLGIC